MYKIKSIHKIKFVLQNMFEVISTKFTQLLNLDLDWWVYGMSTHVGHFTQRN